MDGEGFVRNEEQLKKLLNIDSWRELSKGKFLQYLKLSPYVDKELHIKILEQVPNFVQLASDTIKNLTSLTEQNKEITTQAISVLKSISDSLGELAKKDNLTPEERRDVINAILEVAKMVKEIDKENKGFLEKFGNAIFMIGTVGVGVLALIFGIKFGKGKRL